MKKIEEDTLKTQFNRYKYYGVQSTSGQWAGIKVGGAMTTTGDTLSGDPQKSDDCDTDNDTTSTPPPVLAFKR